MKLKCVGPDEAKEWIGDEVSWKVGGSVLSGKIASIDTGTNVWTVRSSDDTTRTFVYVDVCAAEALFAVKVDNNI